MKSVAILGVSGVVGQTMLRQLEHQPGLHRIVGLDRRPPGYQPPGLEFHPVDLRQAPLELLLRGVESVLLLANGAELLAEDPQASPTPLEPLHRMLQHIRSAGVQRLVTLCPTAALGSHEDNPVPIQEWRPLRPHPSHPLARVWADVEATLERLEPSVAGLTVIRLRAAPVVGASLEDTYTRWLSSARVFTPGRYDPLIQLLHAEDLASACVKVLEQGTRPVYHVAAPHPERLSDLYAAAGVPMIRLPFSDWLSGLHPRWSVLPKDLPPLIQALGPHPTLVSTVAINHELGWVPRYTTREAFLSAREQLLSLLNRHAA